MRPCTTGLVKVLIFVCAAVAPVVFLYGAYNDCNVPTTLQKTITSLVASGIGITALSGIVVACFSVFSCAAQARCCGFVGLVVIITAAELGGFLAFSFYYFKECDHTNAYMLLLGTIAAAVGCGLSIFLCTVEEHPRY
jgi:hypothetical protein